MKNKEIEYKYFIDLESDSTYICRTNNTSFNGEYYNYYHKTWNRCGLSYNYLRDSKSYKQINPEEVVLLIGDR